MLLVQNVTKFLPLIALLLTGFNLLAQDFDVIKIQSAHYPKQYLEESNVDGEIGFFEWGAQVALPQTFRKHKKQSLCIKLDTPT